MEYSITRKVRFFFLSSRTRQILIKLLPFSCFLVFLFSFSPCKLLYAEMQHLITWKDNVSMWRFWLKLIGLWGGKLSKVADSYKSIVVSSCGEWSECKTFWISLYCNYKFLLVLTGLFEQMIWIYCIYFGLYFFNWSTFLSMNEVELYQLNIHIVYLKFYTDSSSHSLSVTYGQL